MNIRNIIEERLIKIFFQPIVSINRKEIIGYEALARGIDTESSKLISPFILFNKAKKANLSLELDNLCRKLAVEKMNKLNLNDKILFLNFEISMINSDIDGKEKVKNSIEEIYSYINKNNLKPQNIVMEIVESNVEDTENLKYFNQLCRKLGFLVALDDVGSGHSNLNRIPLIKPHIIKIDRYLSINLNDNYYKQEVYKSITGLSRKIGALVVAEGLEKKEDVLCAIDLRSNFIQGFYFDKPKEYLDHDLSEKINEMWQEFKFILNNKTLEETKVIGCLVMISEHISSELNNRDINIEDSLRKYINKYIFIECLYLIDSEGIQISDTIFKDDQKFEYNKSIFSPGINGTDHSLKSYFYQLIVSENKTYVTDQYISMATGNKCITFSKMLKNDLILAIDIDFRIFKNHVEKEKIKEILTNS